MWFIQEASCTNELYHKFSKNVAFLQKLFYNFTSSGEVLKILEKKGETKYWLFNQLEMSYTNFNNIVTNNIN